MSVARVRYIKQFFGISNYSFDSTNGILTITTANSHNLFTGIPITVTSDKSYDAVVGTANVTSSNTFTIRTNIGLQYADNFCVNGYLPGQTNGQQAHTLPRGTGCNTVIQSYVNGAGGSTYNIHVSLDGNHWVALNTVIHGSSDGNTMYSTIEPGWAYMRANLVSVGANTNLVIMTSE